MEHPPQPQPADPQPEREARHFLIEHGDVLYLAKAIASYDRNAAGITPEQVAGVGQVRGAFDELGAQAMLRAVRIHPPRHNYLGSRTGRTDDDGGDPWPPTG